MWHFHQLVAQWGPSLKNVLKPFGGSFDSVISASISHVQVTSVREQNLFGRA